MPSNLLRSADAQRPSESCARDRLVCPRHALWKQTSSGRPSREPAGDVREIAARLPALGADNEDLHAIGLGCAGVKPGAKQGATPAGKRLPEPVVERRVRSRQAAEIAADFGAASAVARFQEGVVAGTRSAADRAVNEAMANACGPDWAYMVR